MSYVIATTLILPYPRAIVYKTLSDLSRSPEWSMGMICISPQEIMWEGMRFRTSVRVCGITNKTVIAVENLVPNEIIELVSKTGQISFRSLYKLVESSAEETELIYTLRFEFKGFIFNADRQVIESMAKARCHCNLVALRDLIERDLRTSPVIKGSQSTRQ